MARRTKLLLIPCSGEETLDLTKDIYKILRNDYNLGDQVEYLGSNRQSEIPKGTPKDHQHSLVGDYFPDKEVQTNVGRNELKDLIRGKHIALVEHLLTPNRKEGVKQMFKLLRNVLAIAVLGLWLATPSTAEDFSFLQASDDHLPRELSSSPYFLSATCLSRRLVF